MIISCFPVGYGDARGNGGSQTPILPDFTYTGDYETMDDGDGNWRLRLLTSGALTFTGQQAVDLFAVGGGSGGHAKTESNKTLIAGHAYEVTIGAGGAAGTQTAPCGPGGETSMEGMIRAAGGATGAYNAETGEYGIKTNDPSVVYYGCSGGTGGGAGSKSIDRYPNNPAPGNGGSDGGDGEGTPAWACGTGRGTTTREFGEAAGELYAGGGAGGNCLRTTQYKGGAGGGGDGAYGWNTSAKGPATDGLPNTGGGGGGGAWTYETTSVSYGLQPAGAGGSGILIIRNHRE